ncbi:MAG: hypothetical protein WCO40_07115 [Thermoleophilia bacterium]
MAVHDEQADVATVELTGSGIDILLPPPTMPVRKSSRARLWVACALVLGIVVVGALQLVHVGGVNLIPSLAPATRILPSGAPRPQTMARQDQLVLLVPIQQSRVTAILFHPVVGADALPLEPVGQPLDEGIFANVISSFAGDNAGGPDYQTDGDTTSVDIGAPVGTDTYAPVDGKVLSITPLIVNGTAYGDQIAIEPIANPGVVVIATGIQSDPKLSVGVPVSTRPEAWTKLGRIVDITGALDPLLSKYTQDGGNRIHLEVRPATAVAAS